MARYMCVCDIYIYIYIHTHMYVCMYISVLTLTSLIGGLGRGGDKSIEPIILHPQEQEHLLLGRFLSIILISYLIKSYKW